MNEETIEFRNTTSQTADEDWIYLDMIVAGKQHNEETL